MASTVPRSPRGLSTGKERSQIVNKYEQHAVLTCSHRRLRPVLEHVQIDAQVTPPLLEVTIAQHYRNASKRALEIVYTFPVPTGAALLGVEFELDQRKLVGQVKARRAASEDYDRAVEAGDAAVLVEQQRDGMYTASLGNLKPGERAVIRLRYGTLLEAQGDDWRIAIPTVLAPFYGSAESDAGIDARAAPVHSIAAAYPLELSLDVAGLSDAQSLRCISHECDITDTGGSLRAVLKRDARLDRDVVFLAHRSSRPTALLARDGEGVVVVASTVLGATEVAVEPVSVRLVLDCSGSMAGDSMDWAAVGCHKLMDALTDGDEFSITRFGSNVDHLTAQLVASNAANRERYGQRLLDVVADLGGTEMEAALRAAAALKSARSRSDIVLLTDGEIWASDALVRWARVSGLRIFVIGVGSSPNHPFLQRLAVETGGSCDFVTPGEDIIAAVARVVERLRRPQRGALNVSWPASPLWKLQLPAVAHEGQAVHIIAGLTSLPEGEITIEQATIPLPSSPQSHNTLARVVAYQRLLSGQFDDAAEAAERYQLVTEWTHLVAVLERAADDKTVGLPDIARVEHMVAAGWSGTGRASLKNLVAHRSVASRSVDRMMASNSFYSASLSFEVDDEATPRNATEQEAESARARRRVAVAHRAEELARWVRAINRLVLIDSVSGITSLPTLTWLAAIVPTQLAQALCVEAEAGPGDVAVAYAFLEVLDALDNGLVERLSGAVRAWLAAHYGAVDATLESARDAAERVLDVYLLGAGRWDLNADRRAAA